MTRTIDDTFSLSIVSPVFNEKDIVPELIKEIHRAIEQIAFPGKLEIVLVNDGSSDGSDDVLDRVAGEFPGQIKVVHLARNFGLETAISAGLDHTTGDAVIVMDSDLQDDPAAIGPFLEKWTEGYDVAYAVRTSRKESFLRRFAFWLFYRGLKLVAEIDLPLDASNFALMDRRVVNQLCAMPERNRYLRGLRAWIGFRQTGVPVPRLARHGEESRLGFRGQWKLAMNALFSFSYVPLFLFRILGIASVFLSVALIFYAVFAKWVMGIDVQSWASLMVAVSFFGGMNLLGLGTLGEYLARVFDEVRARPLYTVERVVQHGANSPDTQAP